MRVQLIEDDDLHAEVVARWMTRELTVDFERFRSVEEFYTAVNAADAVLPDLVFVDYHLGEKNGLEFVSELRADDGDISGVGVVLFSGMDSAEFLTVLVQMDVDGFLLKDDLSRDQLMMVAHIANKSAERRRALREMQKQPAG